VNKWFCGKRQSIAAFEKLACPFCNQPVALTAAVLCRFDSGFVST
jgi:hypothetical protein